MSGSGKTTLAQKLSKKYNLKIISSDYLLYSYKNKSRLKNDLELIEKEVDKLVNTDNWVFEGVSIIPKVLEASDKIIFLKISLLTLLYRQWFRFLTNKTQCKEHGFLNNVKHSKSIIHKYFSKTLINDYYKSNRYTLNFYINKYKSKLLTYNNNI